MSLPPGQILRSDFPRFGLTPYARRFPSGLDSRSILVTVPHNEAISIDIAKLLSPRVRVHADFHCVTTWSYAGIEWGGIRFVDFYREVIQSKLPKGVSIAGVVLCAQDGYRTTLLLEDVLDDSVLIADEIDGQALSIEHGAPLRLVAPRHYGYKNLKHLKRIEFHLETPVIKRGFKAFLDHPRARVVEEERGRWVAGKILRYLYRPLIKRTVREFEVSMNEYNKDD